MSESLIFYYLIIWAPLGYILGALGMLVEGDLIWFTLSFLTSLGFFRLDLILLAVFLGIFINDSLLFLIGRTINRWPQVIRLWAEKIARPFDRHFQARTLQTLLISKFAYGVHKPILIRFGMIGVSYWQFVKADILAIVLWMAVIGSLGYFSGLSFFLVKSYLHYAEVGLLVGLIALVVGLKILTSYSLKKL